MRRLLPLLLLAACSADKGPALEPEFADGKADVGDQVIAKGGLALGGEATTTFTGDLQFYGWTIETRAGAHVTLEVTQRGSARGLDTTLYLYGPKTENGGFGTTAIAFDDDAGYGKLSKLRGFTVTDAGVYLVVLGTHDGRGRGNVRVTASCDDGLDACNPVVGGGGDCPVVIAADIRACVTEFLADPDNSGTTEAYATELCADAEPVADAYDATCGAGEKPIWCEGDYETFATTVLPVCLRELQGEILDRTCALGDTFYNLRQGTTRGVGIVGRRVIESVTGLSRIEKEQVVEAVKAASYEGIRDAADALSRVDEEKIFVYEIWDATNRRTYQAFEYGAGDNSYGKIFHQGTTQGAARIGDGDLYDCTVFMGPELRTCSADGDCAGALTCTGIAAELGRGVCLDTTVPESPGTGASCSETSSCPSQSGLTCGGLTRGTTGECAPAWATANFETTPDLAIPDARAAGVTSTIYAYGLGAVDTDVTVAVRLRHPRIADLKIVLTNPAGTAVTVWEDPSATGELWLDQPVLGFTGRDAVNGAWQLKVIDKVRGGGSGDKVIDFWSVKIASK